MLDKVVKPFWFDIQQTWKSAFTKNIAGQIIPRKALAPFLSKKFHNEMFSVFVFRFGEIVWSFVSNTDYLLLAGVLLLGFVRKLWRLPQILLRTIYFWFTKKGVLNVAIFAPGTYWITQPFLRFQFAKKEEEKTYKNLKIYIFISQ